MGSNEGTSLEVEPREVHMAAGLERGRCGRSAGWVPGLIPEWGLCPQDKGMAFNTGGLRQVTSGRCPTQVAIQ